MTDRASPPVDVVPAMSDDYGSRHNVFVDTLVLHTTEGGSIGGAIDHWKQADVHASAHYVLDGARVVQCVPEGFAAYACGNQEANRRSISIEVVGHAGQRATWTPEIVAQLTTLAAEICERHSIPVLHGCPGIIGHEDVVDPHHPALRGGISHHRDPGPFFPWQPFFDEVRALLSEPLASAPVPPAVKEPSC